MPRRKPKPEKVIQEKIKESLDSIIMEESLDTVKVDEYELPRMKTTELMNFAEEKLSALSDAQTLMDSISNFYVDPSVHGNPDMVGLKKKMDALNISAMMFQMKSAQHAITKLLEEIDLGNMQPRLLEVLAQLQSQIMQMPKDYQQYLEKVEQNYKKIKLDLEEKSQSGAVLMSGGEGSPNTFSPQYLEEGSGIRSRGTRSIMEGIRGILGTEVVDVKPIEIEPNAVVNAREKRIIDEQQGIIDEVQDDSGFIIEDDIIN